MSKRSNLSILGGRYLIIDPQPLLITCRITLHTPFREGQYLLLMGHPCVPAGVTPTGDGPNVGKAKGVTVRALGPEA